jgi:hypothetical protein
MPQSPIYHKPWDFPWRDKKISPNKRIWDRSLSLSLKFSPSVYKITFFALREAVADMGFAGWTFPSVSVPLNPLWILLRLPLSLSLSLSLSVSLYIYPPYGNWTITITIGLDINGVMRFVFPCSKPRQQHTSSFSHSSTMENYCGGGGLLT